MNNSIYPCLILKGKAAAAADFYISTFGEGKITSSSPVVIQIELSGQKFMLLNDGPPTAATPSVSFMVSSENAVDTERYWNNLLEGGQVLMPLDQYDWSVKYGWIQDKYGISWQLFTSNEPGATQKFSPSLMFTGSNAGKAQKAVEFYTQLFPQSGIEGIYRYTEEEGADAGLIKHAQFKIRDFTMTAMDSTTAHGFTFNEAVSIVIECDTQEEIDRYWELLSENGGEEMACGWVSDKFGLSWQVVPKILGTLFTDPEKGNRVMNALLQMKKLIIADLVNA